MKNPDGTLCSEPDNAESFPDWASIGGISIKGSCRAFSRAGRNPGASRAGRTGLRTQAGPSRLISGGGAEQDEKFPQSGGKQKSENPGTFQERRAGRFGGGSRAGRAACSETPLATRVIARNLGS